MSFGVYQQEPLLKDRFILLSASKPSRSFHRFPLARRREDRTSVEIEEAVVSLARAVFSHQGRLVFGGHPTISPLVASVAAEYFPARHIAPGKEPVWIYQSEAFRQEIAPSTRDLEALGYARIHWIERFDDEQPRPELAGQEQCLESLRLMREAMIELRPGKNQPHNPPDHPLAMVAIGGMEGVIREAQLFLERTDRHVYVLQTTAGAASQMVPYLQRNIVQDKTPLEMKGWESRVSVLEETISLPKRELAGATGRDDLPLAPYAVLMQNMVLRIAGKDPRKKKQGLRRV